MKTVWIVSECWDYEGCAVISVFDTEYRAEEFADTQKTGMCTHTEVEKWEVKE